MKNWQIVVSALVVLVLFILGLIRSQRMAVEREQRSRQQCLDMGGQPILDYSYSSDSFYLTGCKLDPVRR